MKKSELIKIALANSLGVVVYISLVALFMRNASSIFGKVDNVFGGIIMLLLLVFSAAVTGSLVFAKPVLVYLDGAKKEAVKLLIYTIAWLFVWLVVSCGLVLALR